MSSDHRTRFSRRIVLHGDPRTQTVAKRLIDLEESQYARAVVLGLLREDELWRTYVKLGVRHTR